MTNNSSIGMSVIIGLVIALVQSSLSVFAMRLALDKKSFYWVWGGGLLFRLLVFSATAFVVYRYTTLSLVATLLSLVTATMGFLIFESSLILKNR